MKAAKLATLLLSGLISASCLAQTSYPAKPIHVFVGFGVGGVTDLCVRIISDEMGRRMGQAVVVENKPGVSGLLAAQVVKAAAPDGYTLFGGSPTGFHPLYYKESAIVAGKELTPVSQIALGDLFAIVTGNLPVRDLKELAAYARANSLRFASPAETNNMLMAYTAKRYGFSYEPIPYKTTDQTVAAMLAGDAQITFNSLPGYTPYLPSGRLRIIWVFSHQRPAQMPDVPTAVELGLPVEYNGSFSLWGPPGMARDVVMKLNAAAAEAVKVPSVIEKVHNLSYNPLASSPEELLARFNSDVKLLTEAAEASGHKPE